MIGQALCYPFLYMPISSFWPRWNEQPVFTVLLGVLLGLGVLFLSSITYKTFRESLQVGYGEHVPASISVSAEGTAIAQNNLATIDMGVSSVASSASAAEESVTRGMNALTAALRDIGIPAEDLQTVSYTVYPQYDYEKTPAIIVGYEASSLLTITIRDSALVNTVLGIGSELGITNISGLRFTVDDASHAQDLARAEAIEKARTQAEVIADAMGVTLGRIVSYSESVGGSGMYPLYRSVVEDSASSAPIPDVQMGQDELSVAVYIQYALE